MTGLLYDRLFVDCFGLFYMVLTITDNILFVKEDQRNSILLLLPRSESEYGLWVGYLRNINMGYGMWTYVFVIAIF